MSLPRAIIIIEVNGTIIMAKMTPEEVQLDHEYVGAHYEGQSYMDHIIVGSRIMIRGRILETVRTWDNWNDFYTEMIEEPNNKLPTPGAIQLPPAREL